MSKRRIFWVVFCIGLVYFILFFFPNAYGARNEAVLAISSQDEFVTYPNVVRILTPGKTFNDTRANLFLYEDYHYGYPFYAASALVLLPVRLMNGSEFTQNMQLNMLLLRQFISALPLILAAGFLVYMQTRFQSLVKSAALFVFLLSIRGVVRNHIWWWHPDALAVLSAILTLFFLDRDRLRFGRNFYFAAAACGLAIAIKLLGFFFFLTIPAYILAGLVTKRIGWPKAGFVAAAFVVVMMATAIFSNPFLFSDEQRARMIEIQAEKTVELDRGYEHDNSLYYSKGPQWWTTTLEKWYGSPIFLVFLFISLAAGSLWGPRTFTNRLILTWVVPYSIYLLYFVAVKPDHYWLPVMLPLFSSAFVLVEIFQQRINTNLVSSKISWQRVASGLVTLILVVQFVLNLTRETSGNIPLYRSFIQTGITQIQTIR